MAPNRRSGSSNDEKLDIAALIVQQLQNILPQIVIQVTNNVNNANANGGNGRNGRNNGCSYKTFLACNPRDYDRKGCVVALTRWIEKMEYVIENSGCVENQKVKYVASSFINKALTWWNTLVQERGREATIGYTDRFHELAKLVPHLVSPESKRIGRYINGLPSQIRGMLQATKPTPIQNNIIKVRILTDVATRYGTLARSSEKRKKVAETSKQGVRQVAPISVVRMENNQRVCYECGSSNYLRNNCPKLNRAHGQAENRLALKGNQNTQNNRNQARGRTFSVNAVDALQDPNVVTGTFSLNNYFATVLFDYGADFSFISTKFTPLLNVKPSIVSPRYVIEVANGKKEDVDRIIRDCKLELVNSLFTIDLIPLGHGNFHVIMGMDCLSKNKAVIVCHEKMVRIPLDGGETKEEHKVHLKLVLELLKKERLYAKLSKFKFCLQEVHFLNHVVNHNSIYVDPRFRGLEGNPKCCQAKGLKDEEKLVHLKMVVKLKVLIEKKKMCSLGLMSLIFLEGLEEEALIEFMVELFEDDEDGKKNEKDGLFNLKANDQSRKA
uniref:Reverse transcriptase domain-containing protein n=1 Tax=Tanacetum cinerariifolium TaxID=118510 RepID=A0A6L2J1L4_TANCI|nr:hypothetical protein [Tanacetum cinerariifolium]